LWIAFDDRGSGGVVEAGAAQDDLAGFLGVDAMSEGKIFNHGLQGWARIGRDEG
jgi:hypothetical protein